MVELDAAECHHGYEADHEHEASEQTEKVHRFPAEFISEPEGYQIKIPVDETIEAEFRFAVFSCLMMHHFFSYAVKTGVFCKVGDVAVHVAIHFYALDHLVAVGFQSAVEVVQIVYAAHFAGGGVEELCGYGF